MKSPQQDAVAGLFAERTHLAWQRTALTFLGCGALLVHVTGGLGHPLSMLPGLFGMAVAAVIFARDLLRYREAVAVVEAGGGDAASPRRALLIGAAATVLSVSGLVVVLATP